MTRLENLFVRDFSLEECCGSKQEQLSSLLLACLGEFSNILGSFRQQSSVSSNTDPQAVV